MRRGKSLPLRGRRVFVWFWAAFLSIQFVGGLVIDYALPQLRFPFAYDLFASYEQLERSPDVLLLGSSRTQSSLIATTLTTAMRNVTGHRDFEAFNAYVPAGDMITSEFVLQELWDRGARPKMIVLETMPEEVNHRNDWLKQHVFRQLRWEDMPTYAPELLRTGHLLRTLKARLVPLYAYRYEMCKQFGLACKRMIDPPPMAEKIEVSAVKKPRKKRTPWYELIKMEKPIPPEHRHETIAGLKAVRSGLRDFRVGGNSVRSMERILEFCKKHDISVVLLGIPVTKAHRDLYTPEIESKFCAYLRRVHDRYAVPFLDCRDSTPDWMFVDNHHAHSWGGIYFTHHFARDILARHWSPAGMPVKLDDH